MGINDWLRVVAAIIMHDDRVLLARKRPGKPLAGLWEFPGGKVEIGESEENALKREVLEELGLRIAVAGFFGENRHQYPGKSIELRAYLAKFESGTIQLHDHDQCHWLSKNELPHYPLAPADIPIAQQLMQYDWQVLFT